ncbi:MAG: hypothetical protein WB608_00585 [Terracidiphilus sp.]
MLTADQSRYARNDMPHSTFTMCHCLVGCKRYLFAVIVLMLGAQAQAQTSRLDELMREKVSITVPRDQVPIAEDEAVLSRLLLNEIENIHYGTIDLKIRKQIKKLCEKVAKEQMQYGSNPDLMNDFHARR